MIEVILISLFFNGWTGHTERTVIGGYETRVLCENEKDRLSKGAGIGRNYLCVKEVK